MSIILPHVVVEEQPKETAGEVSNRNIFGYEPQNPKYQLVAQAQPNRSEPIYKQILYVVHIFKNPSIIFSPQPSQ